MVSLWVTLATAVVVAVAMEPYSAVVHALVWHGPLWRVHRHHHRERLASAASGRFSPNDVLSLSHVPLALALCIAGVVLDGTWAAVALGAGLGMTAYGLAYLLFHDGVVHARLPVAFLSRFRVVRAWARAHEEHHATNAAPWGFFLSPYLRKKRSAAGSRRLYVDDITRP